MRQCSGSREPNVYKFRPNESSQPEQFRTMSEGGKSFRKGPYDKDKGGKIANAGRDALPPQSDQKREQEEEAILLEPWKDPEEKANLSETTKAGIKWCRMINVLNASVAKLLDNRRLELEVMNSQMSSLHQALEQLERVWNEAEASGHLHCEGFDHLVAQIKKGELKINKKYLDMKGPEMTSSTAASSSNEEVHQQLATIKNPKANFVLISDSTGLQGNSKDHHKLGEFAKEYLGKFFDQVHIRAEGGARIFDTIARGTGKNKETKPAQDYDYTDHPEKIFPGILKMVEQEVNRVGGTYDNYPHHIIAQSSMNEAAAKKGGKAHDLDSEQPHPEIDLAKKHWDRLANRAAGIPLFTLIAAGDEESWQLPGFQKYVDHNLKETKRSGCLCYSGIPIYNKMTKLVSKSGTVDDWHWACTENNQDKQCLMYLLLTRVRYIINELKISLGPRNEMLVQERLPPGEEIDIHENNIFNVLAVNHRIIRQQKVALGETNNKFYSRLSKIPDGEFIIQQEMIALACEWANYQRTLVAGDYLTATGSWNDYHNTNHRMCEEWNQMYPFGTHHELFEPGQIFGPIEDLYVVSVENKQKGGFTPCLGVRCAQQNWSGGPLQTHGYTIITRGDQQLAKLETNRGKIKSFVPALLSENGKAELKCFQRTSTNHSSKSFKRRDLLGSATKNKKLLQKQTLT